MSETPKCCETCKWFDLYDEDVMGQCSAPRPDCFSGISRRDMYRLAGENCPCHAPRDAQPPTEKAGGG